VQYALRGGEIGNTVTVFRSPRHATDPDAPGWGGPEELHGVFAGMCAPVQEALPLPQRDRHWQMYDREPIPTWVDGRLALLGDAAHPMLQYLAQGACQSMEDGVALPDAITGAADVPTGLAGYADARRDRAAPCRRLPGSGGRYDVLTGWPGCCATSCCARFQPVGGTTSTGSVRPHEIECGLPSRCRVPA